MAKRNTFAEIIEAPFRWPTAGDEAFLPAENPMDDALIEKNDFVRLTLMIEGYRQVAELAVAKSAEDRFTRDFLVYPAIFNYRHFIELSLKHLIATYGVHVGVDAIWNSHDLERLWLTFSEVLQRFGTEDPEDADPVVASIVAEFAKLDPRSDAYRYPKDQKGNPLPLTFTRADLENLADVMKAVSGYFTGCDGYLSELAHATG